jgi:O-antigen/teichoic acid export membrane protein
MSFDELTAIAQKAARGGVFLFIGYASSTVILAVGMIMVARLLGPSSYGLYTLATVVPLLLVPLSDVGMNFALVRLPARLIAVGDYARASAVIRLGFLLKLSVSVVAFIFCYVGSDLIAAVVLNRPGLAPFLRIASMIIVFQAMFDGTINSFIGQDLMQYSAIVQIVEATLKGTLGAMLVLIGLGIGGALSGYVLALATAGLTGAVILLTRQVRSSRQLTDSKSMHFHTLLRYGLPLYVATALSMFLIQYQNIVLAHFASNIEVGNFGATMNFNSFMMILIYPITMAMFPMFSKMDVKKRKRDLARGFVLAVKYTSLIMIPASVAVMIFSRNLIYLTYGVSYTFAPQYLVLLSALYLLTVISYLVLDSFLNGVAETRTVLRMSILSVVVYLPLGPLLVWFLGPYGLLITYILCNAVSTLYGLRRASTILNAHLDLKASGRIVFAALGAAIPTMVLVQFDRAGVGLINLIVGGVLYLVVYLTLAPILGAVDKQDIANLRTILSKMRIFAKFVDPLFDYEVRLLSAMELGRTTGA